MHFSRVVAAKSGRETRRRDQPSTGDWWPTLRKAGTALVWGGRKDDRAPGARGRPDAVAVGDAVDRVLEQEVSQPERRNRTTAHRRRDRTRTERGAQGRDRRENSPDGPTRVAGQGRGHGDRRPSRDPAEHTDHSDVAGRRLGNGGRHVRASFRGSHPPPAQLTQPRRLRESRDETFQRVYQRIKIAIFANYYYYFFFYKKTIFRT